MKLRTGAEYRESLHDGRKVWILGEGRVNDVVTHPATRGMVQEYVDWYDRHFDPEWQDVLFAPPDAKGERLPYAYMIPSDAADMVAMGKSYSDVLLLSAGNITHDPAYGNLITLGILDRCQNMNVSQKQIDDAAAYRQLVADTGRFVTFSAGGPTIGYRFREDPAERNSVKIVKERDDGLVIQGKVGMHTSPPYVDDIYVGSFCNAIYNGLKASFAIPVNAPGVTVVCRKMSARHKNPFIAPLSQRFDELDGQLWLDDVFVPWERVFFIETDPADTEAEQKPAPSNIASWLFWHQLYCWFEKGEFVLGTALACADAMGLKQHPATIEYLVDMIVDLQTVRSCLTAAERDHDVSVAGYAMPNNQHIASGSIAMQKARQRLTEILRILPGSSLVVAPSDADLAAPEMKEGLEASFGGGGYTALQRSALLNMAWDLISSGMDGRESAFELHSNGGIPVWRNQARARFPRYNQLANGVLKAIDIEMPEIDVSGISKVAASLPRREVTVTVPTEEKTEGSVAPGSAPNAR